MNHDVVFGVIVVFVCLGFLAERVLEWLNLRVMPKVLPDGLQGIYEAEEYVHFNKLDCWNV